MSRREDRLRLNIGSYAVAGSLSDVIRNWPQCDTIMMLTSVGTLLTLGLRGLGSGGSSPATSSNSTHS